MIKRTIVLIDGSNFYFKLKDLKLQNQLNLQFAEFCKKLCNNAQFIFCKYYIGAIKTDGTTRMKKLHSQQQKLFVHLKDNGIQYELGYLLKSNNRFQEKGVDVQIATDILKAAYENQADKIILISSDTDLLPAIKQAQILGKQIHYIGFKHKPSFGLIQNCYSYELLSRKDLLKFY